MVSFERIPKDGAGGAAAGRTALAAVAAALILALTIWALGLMAWAVAARAGRYHVYSCRMPDGEAAPVDGWRGSTAGPHSYAEDTCPAPGGALLAALGDETGRQANQEDATWEFAPAASQRLVGAALWRAGDADGGNAPKTSYEFSITAPELDSNPFSECYFSAGCYEGVGSETEPLAAANRIEIPSADLGGDLYAWVGCTGSTGWTCAEHGADPRGYAAAVFVFAADLVLEQEVGPQVDDVGGELASVASVAGTSDVSFTASDPGSGVYEALFTVDGQVVQRTVIDENGGRCRDVGQTTDGLAAFLYVQPCPASVSADVGFDSGLVGNGAHHLVVSVIDAAGNSATVLDRQITVDNPGAPGPPNGTNASANASLSVNWTGTARRRLTTIFGRRHQVVGRLLAAGGVPISNAIVEVDQTPESVGASTSASSHALTNAQGRFSLMLPASVSSRTLQFIYRSHMGAAAASATATLQLAVAAGVTLSIAPRTVSVGHSIHFTGRLLGGPVPREGKQLVLEARAPGGSWIEFDDVRTSPRGVFHAGYRFKFPGPATYQFRVLSEPESDYPYSQGTSNVVDVHEL